MGGGDAGVAPVWISSTAEVYRLAPPPIDDVVNPIGCGDCLAAGIAWATRHGDTVVDAVRLGIGAAADNIGQLLPGRLQLDRVMDRAEKVVVSSKD